MVSYSYSVNNVIYTKKSKTNYFQIQDCIAGENHTVCNTLVDQTFTFIIMKFLFLLLELLYSNMSTQLPHCYWFVASFTYDNHSNELKSDIVLELLYLVWTVHGNEPGGVILCDLN